MRCEDKEHNDQQKTKSCHYCRNLWRRAVHSHRLGSSQIQLVFVVAEARSAGQQLELAREHQTFGDIVQSSVADGHRLLAYKLLMG